MKYANSISYSDINPHEVVRVVSDKCLEIRRMKAEKDPSWKPEWHAGGFAGHCANQHEQRWFITPQPLATVFRIRKQKDGKWRSAHRDEYRLADAPRKFYDYNF